MLLALVYEDSVFKLLAKRELPELRYLRSL